MKKNSKVNAGWHEQHRMPKNASVEERVAWHLEHLKHCQCRNDIPEKLKKEMKTRGIVVPV